MNDIIKDCIERGTPHSLYLALKDVGVECEFVGHYAGDDAAVDVPGYGLVFYDERSDPANPGWVVRGDTDDAVTDEQLVEELGRIIEWARAIA